jgi:hypothetical protein
MPPVYISELIPVLQVAVGPVVLISGVGLLLLTMTNRLGRVIDRSRILTHELRTSTLSRPERDRKLGQLKILVGRGKTLRQAIALAGLSVLLAAVLIILLFLTALLGLEIAWLITLCFISGMLALIGSLTLFIWDVNRALAALNFEIDEVLPQPGSVETRPPD